MNNGQPLTAAAMHRQLLPLQHILAHAPITADTRLLLVCPHAITNLAGTLREIIRYHPVGSSFSGSVRVIYHRASTVPTLSMVRNLLPRDDPHYHLVVVYGYGGIIADLSDLDTQLWIDNMADLVHPKHPRLDPGNLLIELKGKPGEIWTDTALRYDELLYNNSIRLLSINSIRGSVATDRRTLVSRFRSLAQNLEHIPNAPTSHFISYLKCYARSLEKRTRLLNKDILDPKGEYLGLFVRDETTREQDSRWKYVDGSAKATSIDGVAMDPDYLALEITNAWEADETPNVGTEPYFETYTS